MKLSPKNLDEIDTLLINGAECEPYITSDHRCMLEDTHFILSGIKAVMKYLNIPKCIIGIEGNKPDAIAKMQSAIDVAGIEVKQLPCRYPQGAEKVLIETCTGREVPFPGLPSDVGVIVMNVTSTAFVGKTGQDEFGSYLRRVLAEHGVDVTGLHTDRSPTSLAVVSVSPGGERSFRFMRGADTNLSPDEIDEGWVDRSKVLHFGSVSLTAGMSRSATIFAARRAHKTGKLVSYDPNYRPSLWRGREEAMQWLQIPLPLAGLVKMSQEELPLLTGSEDLERGSQILEDMGIRLVVVTLGDRGAFYRWRGRTGLVPGVDVEAVDTNGAGDTFLGALLYRLTRRGDSPLEGLTVSELEEALDFSNRAAALTCTRPGAIPAMPTLEELSGAGE